MLPDQRHVSTEGHCGIVYSLICLLALEWRQQYVTRCVTPVLGVIRAANTYSYTRVVKLDAAIRDFPIPSFLRMPSLPDSPRSMELTSQRAYISIQRDFCVCSVLHLTY